uniref:LacI family DNA-binding transcriptional regulator n=1 Tax=Bosea sp. NBC_00436 TaxID=2969620 RepID=A0A9E7ZZF7_9HYPH
MNKVFASGKSSTVRMSDVAQAAGVSPMTVSNSFKHPEKVVEETRRRVLDTAAKLGYVPNLVAGNLVSGRSKIVATITPSIQNSNFAGMIMGLENELEAHGYHLIVSVVEAAEREYDAVRALIGRRVDGIVLTGVDREDATRRLLEQSGVPTVETWNLSGPFVDMGVGFSTHDAACEATQIMIDSGLRNIGIAGYETAGNRRFQERLCGFREAMTSAGLRDDLIATVPGWTGFAGGKIALERLLEREPHIEGVFCFSDVLGAGIIFECMRRGWPVPERLAVVGYGDYEIAAELPPGLTTVHTPGDKIGEVAAQLIMMRCNDSPIDKKIIDVGYSIVVRGST